MIKYIVSLSVYTDRGGLLERDYSYAAAWIDILNEDKNKKTIYLPKIKNAVTLYNNDIDLRATDNHIIDNVINFKRA